MFVMFVQLSLSLFCSGLAFVHISLYALVCVFVVALLLNSRGQRKAITWLLLALFRFGVLLWHSVPCDF